MIDPYITMRRSDAVKMVARALRSGAKYGEMENAYAYAERVVPHPPRGAEPPSYTVEIPGGRVQYRWDGKFLQRRFTDASSEVCREWQSENSIPVEHAAAILALKDAPPVDPVRKRLKEAEGVLFTDSYLDVLVADVRALLTAERGA